VNNDRMIFSLPCSNLSLPKSLWLLSATVGTQEKSPCASCDGEVCGRSSQFWNKVGLCSQYRCPTRVGTSLRREEARHTAGRSPKQILFVPPDLLATLWWPIFEEGLASAQSSYQSRGSCASTF